MSDLHHAPPEPSGAGDLFLDFANTIELTGGLPADHVPDGGRLLGWLRDHGLASAAVRPAHVESALGEFRALRDVVREVTARQAGGRRPTRAQLERLNAVLREGAHAHELRYDARGGRYAVVPVGDELAQARSAIAGSLAHYLADHDLRRLRVCANDGCRWLFVDRSPAGRRRWCDMRTCGNRAKVARHRARRRGAPSAGADPAPG